MNYGARVRRVMGYALGVKSYGLGLGLVAVCQ